MLPLLPIPNLNATCSRYLNALKPLLNDKQYSNTAQIVENFKNGNGRQLNQRLLKVSESLTNTSYIAGKLTDTLKLVDWRRRDFTLSIRLFYA
jgi:carnitine O-palmitoyltransferase 2, mitochondrial